MARAIFGMIRSPQSRESPETAKYQVPGGSWAWRGPSVRRRTARARGFRMAVSLFLSGRVYDEARQTDCDLLPARRPSMPLRRLLSAFLLLASSTAFAAVDPSLLQDLRWRLIGPFRGGRVLAVTGVPGEPEHFYFGSVNGGGWEPRDAGRTWQPIFDSQPIGSIGALAVAPSDPRVIYVGSGEADMRSDIAQGDGMYKSSDGGKSWTHIGLADSQQIGQVLVDPRNPNVVYVAALGHPYGPNPERGVFRSRDGGRSWTKLLPKDDSAGNVGAIDLAFEPGNPE